MSDARDVIANTRCDQGVDPIYGPYFKIIGPERADAILSALNSAGLKVLGREPTEEMQAVEESFLCRVYDNGDIWRAMFDAAPPLEAPDRASQPTGEA